MKINSRPIKSPDGYILTDHWIKFLGESYLCIAIVSLCLIKRCSLRDAPFPLSCLISFNTSFGNERVGFVFSVHV